jgi:LmbE family N-acetylglucosaminyl deacetylase
MGWMNLKRSTRRRIVVYGGLVAAIWGLYVYQPWEFELIDSKPPTLAKIDPDSSRLFSKGVKVLIVTAHPDDSEFYIGGLLARLAGTGAELHQIICTDGDKGYYLWEDSSKNRKTRREEALAAARAWNGKTLEFLGYKDGRLSAGDNVVNDLATRIAALDPDYIFCFDPEYPPRARHKDHRIAGVATVAAARRAGTGAWLMMFATRAPNYGADISDFWDDQKKLLTIHKSQFYGERLQRVTNMIEDRAVADGEWIDRTYGEGFRCVKVK